MNKCQLTDIFMDDSLVKELEEIGLSEKEAKVYLASLELGPATAQQIAAKAMVSRPNTYIMIESLMGQGLMNLHHEGKKRIYTAAPPSSLKYILLRQKQIIEAKQRRAVDIIEKIQMRNSNEEYGTIRIDVLKGIDGILQHQNMVLEQDNIDEICEVVNTDLSCKVLPPIAYDGDVRNEIKSKFKIRCLYKTSLKGKENIEQKSFVKIKDGNDKIEAALNILGNESVFTIYNADQPEILVITSQAVATTLKTLFEAFWDKTNNYDK